MRAMLPALQQPLRLSMAARNPQLRMIAGGSRAFQTTPTGKVAASSQGRKYPLQWPDTQQCCNSVLHISDVCGG